MGWGKSCRHDATSGIVYFPFDEWCYYSVPHQAISGGETHST